MKSPWIGWIRTLMFVWVTPTLARWLLRLLRAICPIWQPQPTFPTVISRFGSTTSTSKDYQGCESAAGSSQSTLSYLLDEFIFRFSYPSDHFKHAFILHSISLLVYGSMQTNVRTISSHKLWLNCWDLWVWPLHQITLVYVRLDQNWGCNTFTVPRLRKGQIKLDET